MSGPRPGADLPPPSPDALARSQALTARLAQRIAQRGGWMPFPEYMQAALYEPGLGYYDGANVKFGAEGDFVTAPEISPLFAGALARQVQQCFSVLPPRILEFGAGTGVLARDLLAALQRLGAPAASYAILEVSGDLRARQERELAGLPVQWLSALPEDFEGVVIANEVLDVLPVQLFARTAAGVLERGVVQGADGLRLELRPAGAALQAEVAAIEAEAGTLPQGYGSELCPLAGAWIATLARHLRRGVVLLADYGFPRREYYHPQRAMGTLMCHYRQRAHADPLWMPGLNDITAHVDFSACAAAARGAGLEVLGYASQAHFLMNCGILDLLQERRDPRDAGAVQRLVSEAEMGELVKVMALGRGVELALRGFERGDRTHRL